MKRLLIAIVTMVALSAHADSEVCVVFWPIGNITIPQCYSLWEGDPPAPGCPGTPTQFYNDVIDFLEGHPAYRLISGSDGGGPIPPGTVNAATNSAVDFPLAYGSEIRVSDFDLELGGPAGAQVSNYGTWTLLTDNDILPGGGVPRTFITSGTGVFRKTGGSGTSHIEIPFLVTGGGTLDVEEGTVVLGAEAGFNGATISGAGTVLVASNAYFLNTTLTGGQLTIASGAVAGISGGSIHSPVTVEPGGTLYLTNGDGLFGLLTNYGTVVVGDGTGYEEYYGHSDARIYNYGLWVLHGSTALEDADGNTNELFFNAGTLRTTGSGTAYIAWPFTTSGTIDQQGGPLSVSTWQGPSTLYGSATFGGNFGNAGGTLVIASNGVVSLDFNTILNGALTIQAGGMLNLTNPAPGYSLYGVVTNYGTVVVGDGSNSPYLYGYGGAQICNYGLWVLQGSTVLYDADGKTNELFFNAGTLRKTGSGTAYIAWPFTTLGTIDQQGGLLSVPTWQGPSTIYGSATFSGNFGSAGGTLAIASNAVVGLDANATLNGGLTIRAGGTLNLTNPTSYNLYGVLTNYGTVVVGDGSSSQQLDGYGGAQICNYGLWAVQSDSGFSALVNEDGNTNKLFLNAGTLRKTGSGTAYIYWPFTTSGTIDQQGGLLSVSTWQGPSTLYDPVTFSGNFGSAGGTLVIVSNAVVGLDSNTILNGGLTIQAGGTLNLTNSTSYSLYGVLTNYGTVVVAGSSSGQQLDGYGGAQICNYGLWVLQSGSGTSVLVNEDGNTNKLFFNAGTLRKTGSGTAYIDWPFTTSGTIDQQGGLLTMDSSFVQTAGLTLLRGGDLSASQPLQFLGGVLSGTNTIIGNVASSATVSPGLSPGKLTITGNYTQAVDGILKIELAGNSPGTTYDWLAVNGTAALAGKLVVLLTNSFVPATNSAFTFLTAGSLAGAFTTFSYPSNLAAMTLVYNPTSAVLNTSSLLASATPVQVAPATVVNGEFNVSFSGIPGATYGVQYTDVLSPPDWQPLTNIVVPPSGTFLVHEPVALSPTRFYRAFFLSY
jgi:hypothetical protein